MHVRAHTPLTVPKAQLLRAPVREFAHNAHDGLVVEVPPEAVGTSNRVQVQGRARCACGQRRRTTDTLGVPA